MISKPSFPHTTRHIDGQPDITTTIKFSFPFFQQIIDNYVQEAGWFLKNPDMHSMLINSNPALDHLHHILLQQVQPLSLGAGIVNGQAPAKLYVDELVLQVLK
ncbi:hypothetical protein [Paraflavitalea speifideaquila]|uniref:hypothetical protein n=1 Tax=Paraflavitalea speifideaquila TaxID=3076558 RepID=UPI0028E6BB21|nr:hypothetical protein [Paraflavitalea speifideiaquila]